MEFQHFFEMENTPNGSQEAPDSGDQHLTNEKRVLHRSIYTDHSEDSIYLAAGDPGETVPALLDKLPADNRARVEAEDPEGLVLAEPVLVKQLDGDGEIPLVGDGHLRLVVPLGLVTVLDNFCCVFLRAVSDDSVGV